ncbi:MAG: hypothetical protein ACD_79C01495G0001, partial [uncultured bacterium]
LDYPNKSGNDNDGGFRSATNYTNENKKLKL